MRPGPVDRGARACRCCLARGSLARCRSHAASTITLGSADVVAGSIVLEANDPAVAGLVLLGSSRLGMHCPHQKLSTSALLRLKETVTET